MVGNQLYTFECETVRPSDKGVPHCKKILVKQDNLVWLPREDWTQDHWYHRQKPRLLSQSRGRVPAVPCSERGTGLALCLKWCDSMHQTHPYSPPGRNILGCWIQWGVPIHGVSIRGCCYMIDLWWSLPASRIQTPWLYHVPSGTRGLHIFCKLWWEGLWSAWYHQMLQISNEIRNPMNQWSAGGLKTSI